MHFADLSALKMPGKHKSGADTFSLPLTFCNSIIASAQTFVHALKEIHFNEQRLLGAANNILARTDWIFLELSSKVCHLLALQEM